MTHADRWRAFWQRAGARGDGDAVFAELSAHYADPPRAYHSLDPVVRCLDELETARHLAQCPLEVELAIWFHDAVYDPRARDNEAKSAELARRAAQELLFPRASAKRVYHLILATRHDVLPTTADQRLLADIDLSILGAPTEEFDEYERRIREEYAGVSEAEFRAARADILEKFLSRPRLYATEFFLNRYEQAARENLRRSLTRLRSAP